MENRPTWSMACLAGKRLCVYETTGLVYRLIYRALSYAHSQTNTEVLNKKKFKYFGLYMLLPSPAKLALSSYSE